ncbi:hypothetical protein HQ529_04730 [Candidatus Woesearchaeota archaeon]|nr:hypothetical protein [Candidatus Woesearchaeota archaeon]
MNNTILNESINQTINETEPINISTNETENLTEDISEPVVKETGTNQTINETIVQEFVPINKSNQSITIVDTNITIKEGLAKVYNGDILNYDRNFEKKYLEVYNNFSDIEFSRISETAPVDMKVGAVNKNIKGLNINNKTYAIHLIACDQHYNSCNFRINGVPTRKIYSSELSKSGVQKNFRFDEDYELEIKSIKFKFCDNRRFCDYYYESYDLVEVKIVER